MEIVIQARTKAAAEQAIERLKGIEGITVKPPVPKKTKSSPLLNKIARGLKHVNAVEEGKVKGTSALDFVNKNR